MRAEKRKRYFAETAKAQGMGPVMHYGAVAELTEEPTLGHIEQVFGSKEPRPFGLELLTSQDRIYGVRTARG